MLFLRCFRFSSCSAHFHGFLFRVSLFFLFLLLIFAIFGYRLYNLVHYTGVRSQNVGIYLYISTTANRSSHIPTGFYERAKAPFELPRGTSHCVFSAPPSLCGVHQRMLDGPPLVSRWTSSGKGAKEDNASAAAEAQARKHLRTHPTAKKESIEFEAEPWHKRHHWHIAEVDKIRVNFRVWAGAQAMQLILPDGESTNLDRNVEELIDV